MSYQAVAWALDIVGLRGPLKLVLVALAERADDKGGNSHPGFTELQRRASTSRRRVSEAIKALETIGAIQVKRSPLAANKRKGVNHYTLAVGTTIQVPKEHAKKRELRALMVPLGNQGKPAKKGTRVVPLGNQDSSPGGTGTFTEPPSIHHSVSHDGPTAKKKPRAVPQTDLFESAFQAVDDSKKVAREGMVMQHSASASDDGKHLAPLAETMPAAGDENSPQGPCVGYPDADMAWMARRHGVDPQVVTDELTADLAEINRAAEGGNEEAIKRRRTIWYRAMLAKAESLKP